MTHRPAVRRTGAIRRALRVQIAAIVRIRLIRLILTVILTPILTLSRDCRMTLIRRFALRSLAGQSEIEIEKLEWMPQLVRKKRARLSSRARS